MEYSLSVTPKVKHTVICFCMRQTLLGIYPRERNTFIHTKTVARVFIIAKQWKQPKCASIDEWIKKNIVYSCNGIVFIYKKNKVLIHTTM